MLKLFEFFQHRGFSEHLTVPFIQTRQCLVLLGTTIDMDAENNQEDGRQSLLPVAYIQHLNCCCQQGLPLEMHDWINFHLAN